ncbi:MULTISPECIES: glutathione S-transferase family protein [unclassified Pseudomonas]|uniref:glutathione S-transferase family protein n=1 Tax=unclassified Pseudomonas TaxID=196821 RepID=UPI0024470A0C|nr:MULTISPECIES: glutathione S-transferase family protein [unclassified Pseudomonas]MDG9922920.1 glutathione S-transferase family protein [Pseudomonas sp. GD04045]MDH0035716.1 glutathione S-transferase family protein [Pseudomonas sp. GD04019]
MALELYAHPFSSYCQKVLIALYENAIPFEYRLLAPEQPQHMQRLGELWPMRRFPLLVDDGQMVVESSIIIEHLQLNRPGPVRLIPDDPNQALEVRFMDRVFDNYISSPQQKCVFDALRAPDDRDAYGVSEARRMLDTAYAWLEQRLQGRTWAAGDSFSLADCAAAPFLFYADWTQPISEAFPRVRAYRQHLLQRPSFARAVDEARPYRAFFPLGAPDRD